MAGRESQYLESPHRTPERAHRYGSSIHLLSDPVLLHEVNLVCSPKTTQPLLNLHVVSIYQALLRAAMGQEFPRARLKIPTRMQADHPKEAYFEGQCLDPKVKVVCVNLARAGTLPSATCYDFLNRILPPQQIRQDHIAIARQTNRKDKVVGSKSAAQKIGGDIAGRIVLFPDPMGATGSTLIEAIRLYRGLGTPLAFVALHCIVTPEYLARIRDDAPELKVYAVRLDRGLSSQQVLATPPGTHWDKEKGLNSKDYIVPGGGGLGELLNNSFV